MIRQQVRGVAGHVEREFGAVDVLIHSAGGTGRLEPRVGQRRSARPGRARLDRQLPDQHPDRGAAHARPSRTGSATPGGRVLFVSSIAAYRGSGSGAYGREPRPRCTRTRHDLARELGPRGITANVVAPGYIEDTEFFGAADRPRAA